MLVERFYAQHRQFFLLQFDECKYLIKKASLTDGSQSFDMTKPSVLMYVSLPVIDVITDLRTFLFCTACVTDGFYTREFIHFR